MCDLLLHVEKSCVVTVSDTSRRKGSARRCGVRATWIGVEGAQPLPPPIAA